MYILLFIVAVVVGAVDSLKSGGRAFEYWVFAVDKVVECLLMFLGVMRIVHRGRNWRELSTFFAQWNPQVIHKVENS